MAKIAEATIDLSANSARLRTDLAKSRGEVQRWAGQVQRDLRGLTAGFRAVTSIAAGFGIALGARSIVTFIKSSIDAVGGLGELAEQLGISTRALQVYQFGAAQAGVAQGELETGLMALRRAIGDAAGGATEQSRAFAALGIAVTEADGKTRSSEAVWRDIADAYSRAKDKAAFVSHAQDLLSRSLQKLLPLLAGGAAGFDKMAESADAAGAVFGDEAVAAADRASDAFARFGARATANMKAWSLAFSAPSAEILEFIERFDAATSASVALTMATVDTLKIGAHIGELRDRLAEIQSLGAINTLGNPERQAAEIATVKAELTDLLVARRAASSGGHDRLVSLAPPAIETPGADMAREAEKLRDFIAALAFERDQLLRTADAQETYNALKKAGVEFDSEAGQTIREIIEQTQRRRDGIEHLNESMEAEIAVTARWTEEMKKARVAQRDVISGTKLLQDEAEKARQDGRELGLTFTSAFEDMALSGAKFRDVLGGIVTDIQRMFLRKTVTEPVLGFFGDVIGPALTAGLGSMFSGGTAAAGGSLSFGGPRASGGPVTPDKAFLVGEAGPELFVPRSRGDIVPNGAGGPVINLNVDQRGALVEVGAMRRLEGMVRALHGSIEPRAVAAVAGARARDPGLLS